jgi:hypothetical protein
MFAADEELSGARTRVSRNPLQKEDTFSTSLPALSAPVHDEVDAILIRTRRSE